MSSSDPVLRLAAGLPIPWEVERPLPVSETFAARTMLEVTAAALAGFVAGQVPDLYEAGGPDYQLDPPGCNPAVPWYVTKRRGSGDCQDVTAWRLAQIRQESGRWPVARLVNGGPNMLHVRLAAEDPSVELIAAGRVRVGRRSRGPECDGEWGSCHEAGGWIQSIAKSVNRIVEGTAKKPPKERAQWVQTLQGTLKDWSEDWSGDQAPADPKAPAATRSTEQPKRAADLKRGTYAQPEGRRAYRGDQVQPYDVDPEGFGGDWAGGTSTQVDVLHPLLQETFRRAPAGVRLVSGYLTALHQMSLWEARFRTARSKGDTRAPASWSAAEADWPRYARWVLDELNGEHGRPRLLLPGLSKHQARAAMDLGGTAAELDEVERRAPAGVSRAVPGEPWHYEVDAAHL